MKDTIGPEIYSDYKQLQEDIRQQRDQKAKLMKTINHLQQETATQRDKAKHCDTRIAEMELQVGMIEHTQTYKEHFDLGEEKVDLVSFAKKFSVPE